jgi:HD-GYP domain-containing protein (c-di-GMP phosphodiesterase class II)
MKASNSIQPEGEGSSKLPVYPYNWSSDLSRDILIPLEVREGNYIEAFVVLDEGAFPEGGQKTVFDYAGDQFVGTCAGLKIHHQLESQVLEDGYTLTLLKLARSIDLSDQHTRRHGLRTAMWTRRLTRKLGFSAEIAERNALAGKLHDIGKVVVPKAILNKPSPLSDEEWMVVRRHPTFAAVIMEPSHQLRSIIPQIKAHHERYDGTGYPKGLVGEEIPFFARIIAVADAFVTMTEGRVYQTPRSAGEALAEIICCRGHQFDPIVVDTLAQLIRITEVDDSHCKWETCDQVGNWDTLE